MKYNKYIPNPRPEPKSRQSAFAEMITEFVGYDKRKNMGIKEINIDYEGISLVIKELTELYKVHENKEVIDKILRELLLNPKYLINEMDKR